MPITESGATVSSSKTGFVASYTGAAADSARVSAGSDSDCGAAAFPSVAGALIGTTSVALGDFAADAACTAAGVERRSAPRGAVDRAVVTGASGATAPAA